MVPIAPSSTRMRSVRARRNSAMRSVRFIRILRLLATGSWPLARTGDWRCRALRTHAERVTDRISQFGAIDRVEMKFFDAFASKLLHLFDGDGGADHAPCIGV